MPDAPVLLVIDDDPRARGVVEEELRKRYGADYQVIGAGSADDPPGLLARLRDDRRQVSIVLAGQQMPGMTGTQVLAQVGDFHRTAKRLLLIDGGFGPPPEPILQAIALGHIDAMFLESSLPGVFAVGDVRRGSVKRVASAVGEGSVAIRLVHDYLRGNPEPPAG
jgi:thioredoxin reductase (NADPH)